MLNSNVNEGNEMLEILVKTNNINIIYANSGENLFLIELLNVVKTDWKGLTKNDFPSYFGCFILPPIKLDSSFDINIYDFNHLKTCETLSFQNLDCISFSESIKIFNANSLWQFDSLFILNDETKIITSTNFIV